MSEKICNVCQSKYDQQRASCPVCGMANLHIIGDNEDARNMINKIAVDYKQKKLGDADISIHAFEYEDKDGELEIKQTHTIHIAKAIDLVYGETYWFSEKFARIEEDRIMDLEVLLKEQDGTVNTANLQFRQPALEDFWYLGVKLIEGFNVVFCIGNKDVYTETESISLI